MNALSLISTRIPGVNLVGNTRLLSKSMVYIDTTKSIEPKVNIT